MNQNRPRRTRSTLGQNVNPLTSVNFTLNSRYRHNLVPRRSSSVSTPTSHEESFQHQPTRFHIDYDFSFDQKAAEVLARKCQQEQDDKNKPSPGLERLKKKKEAILKPTPVQRSSSKDAVLRPTMVGSDHGGTDTESSQSLLGLLGSAKDSDPFVKTSMDAIGSSSSNVQSRAIRQNLALSVILR